MTQLQSLADAPNTLREYETIYILRPDTQNDRVAEVNQRIRGIVESMDGVVLNVDNWGKRKLAYEIKKELKGIYLYWKYLGTAEMVAEFERNMRMLDSVVRYMTIQLSRDVAPGDRESGITEESYEQAATTAADEEELMMRRTAEEAFHAGSDDDDSDESMSGSDDSDSSSDAGDDVTDDSDDGDDGDDDADNADNADVSSKDDE